VCAELEVKGDTSERHRILNPPDWPPGASASRENIGFGRTRATLQGVLAADNGTTAHNAPGVRLRISRPGERALAARSAAAAEQPHHGAPGPVNLTRPPVEVMTRALLEAGLYQRPASTGPRS
jgi:hypothetical protein